MSDRLATTFTSETVDVVSTRAARVVITIANNPKIVAGDAITITTDTSPIVLTEGSEWDLGADARETASSILDALVVAGLSANLLTLNVIVAETPAAKGLLGNDWGISYDGDAEAILFSSADFSGAETATPVAFIFDTDTELTEPTSKLLSLRNNGTEVFSVGPDGIVGTPQPSSNVSYDNGSSGLSATTAQGAIDELQTAKLEYHQGVNDIFGTPSNYIDINGAVTPVTLELAAYDDGSAGIYTEAYAIELATADDWDSPTISAGFGANISARTLTMYLGGQQMQFGDGGAGLKVCNIVGCDTVTIDAPTIFKSMDTSQRDALTPAAGMVIFNTTTSKLQVYTGAVWADLN